jgi:alpha-D-xyloside xylohydrolase
MPHPVVDRLDTRLLEDRQVVRSFVWSAEVAAVESRSLVLHTIDGVSSVFTRFPEGAPASPASRDRDHEPHHGSVRVDLLTDGIFRVRYAQSPQVPENPTEMVVGRFDGPTKAEVRTDSDRVVFDTAEATVEVALEPFAIHIAGRDGEEICRVGGREKNHLNLWDSYNTGICRTAVGGRPVAVECFALRPREAIYGLGEQFIGLDKVGQTIDLNMVEATGTTTPRSYKNVPFFWSTRGYGIFFNHSSRMTCWIGSRCAPDVQVALEDDFLDYFVILGDPKRILSRYTDITGKSGVPPKWSFGFWQSKISYRSAEETLEVVRRMREAGVPMDVLHLDTHWFRRDWCCDLEFDPERFPDPAGYLAELREQGVKVSLWQLPYIPEGSKLFDALAAVDGFVKTEDGELYDVGLCYTPNFRGAVGCIDFTNPEARRVYRAYLRRLFDLGAKAIKVDFGEQAPVDGVYHDGTPGHRAHNLYPLLYNRTVAEVTEEATGESIIWARSAWAGSQRYPLHWGGDSSANWDNLVPQMAGGLSFGLSGFPFWSQDIGGFFGEADGALMVRWFQIGLFLSHSRIHGFGRRELYEFEDEVQRIGREYIRLRYRLLPYLYGSAIDCAARSLPMARALVVEFPDDPTTWDLDDQWLLGDSLLVVPIVDSSNRRRAYLPGGVWTDWWTGERLEGERWIDVTADLATLPLYVREGGLVPLGPVMNFVDERATDEITLRLAPFAGDGETLFGIPLEGGTARVRYTARRGRHEVTLPSASVRFEVEVLGTEPPRVETRLSD